MSDARLQDAITAIERLAQKQVNENVVPGLAIAVIHKDRVVFSKGFGVRDTKANEKIDTDTVFQLASVSKPLASTVVAALVGAGKISWDSRISELDPAFAMYEPWVTNQLTIRDLFAHRSGLPEHAGDPLEDIGYDRTQVLFRLRFQKPKSSMRSKYAYTNFGLTEGAIASGKAYNLTWEDAASEKLYKPLGMNSTSSRYADFAARPNKALLHVLIDGKWVQKYDRNPDAQSPAGGASSSVNDLAKWMRLQLGDGKFDGQQIVDAPALAETHRPHLLTHYSPLNGLPEFYGLGFNVSYDQEGRLRLAHSGAFSRGAATTFIMVPTEGLGICVLTNAYPIGVAEGLAATFVDLSLYGKATQDWLPLFKQIFADPANLGMSQGPDYKIPPASPTPALLKSVYTGRYSNDLAGEIEVSEKDGALALTLGPKKMTFTMKHYDRDIFTFDEDSENSSGPSGVIFSVSADGKAVSVLVENLNDHGQGLFTRLPEK